MERGNEEDPFRTLLLIQSAIPYNGGFSKYFEPIPKGGQSPEKRRGHSPFWDRL